MFLTIIIFILILSILVFVHELGHFVTAKKSGMNVEEFGLGFPPRLWGFKKGKTIYSINWIPLGGFVKIKGENGEEKDDVDSFSHQPIYKRAIVLSAGVIMNVVLAFVIISFGFMIGLPSVVDNSDIEKYSVSDLKIQIGGVIKDSPAEKAGLKAGDQIIKLDDQLINKTDDLQQYIKDNSDREILVQYKGRLDSTDQIKEVKLIPEVIPNFTEDKAIGVSMMQTGILRFGFFESWYHGAIATWNLLIAIILAFYNLFKNLIVGLGPSVELAGPVGVAVITGKMVDLGFRYILNFTALLSLNLAVINFLPFPALDGGRFLFLIIEKIRRKPVNQKIENVIHNIGFSLLMLLIVVVTYKDIAKHSSGLVEKIRGLF